MSGKLMAFGEEIRILEFQKRTLSGSRYLDALI